VLTDGAGGTRLNASSISASVSPFCTKNARFLSSDEPRTCAARRRVRVMRTQPQLSRGLPSLPPAAMRYVRCGIQHRWMQRGCGASPLGGRSFTGAPVKPQSMPSAGFCAHVR
jgi:hypothetical protein